MDSDFLPGRMPRHLGPDQIWLAWSWEPLVLVSLSVVGTLYVLGISRLWRTAAIGAGIRRSTAASFAAGWLVTAVALVSPLHALGGELFSAHMTQHELLITLGAPLMVLGRPLVPFLWALPVGWRRSIGDAARSPLPAEIWGTLTRPIRNVSIVPASR